MVAQPPNLSSLCMGLFLSYQSSAPGPLDEGARTQGGDAASLAVSSWFLIGYNLGFD